MCKRDIIARFQQMSSTLSDIFCHQRVHDKFVEITEKWFVPLALAGQNRNSSSSSASGTLALQTVNMPSPFASNKFDVHPVISVIRTGIARSPTLLYDWYRLQ